MLHTITQGANSTLNYSLLEGGWQVVAAFAAGVVFTITLAYLVNKV